MAHDSGRHLRPGHCRYGLLVHGHTRHHAYHAADDDAFPEGALKMMPPHAKWLLTSMFYSIALDNCHKLVFPIKSILLRNEHRMHLGSPQPKFEENAGLCHDKL
jgi:hypothetical protein